MPIIAGNADYCGQCRLLRAMPIINEMNKRREVIGFWEDCMAIGTDQLESRSGEGTSALCDVLPYQRMQEIIRTKSEGYAKAQPYPHIVIDGFFDDSILDTVLAEFPNPAHKDWDRHDFPAEVKLQSKNEQFMPLFTR